MGNNTCGTCRYYSRWPEPVSDKHRTTGLCLAVAKPTDSGRDAFSTPASPCCTGVVGGDGTPTMFAEDTLKEWLKGIYKDCFYGMEGCDEPEWSLYTCIADAIALYMKGKSGHAICNCYEHEGCPVMKDMEAMYAKGEE